MAELALGIVGAVAAVDVAIKACKRVVDTCSAIKHAETEIFERSTRLLSNCLALRTQLEFFRQIGDQLDMQDQIVEQNVLEIIIQKLDNADAKLRGFVDDRCLAAESILAQVKPKALSKRDRANYVRQKSSLDEAIVEIEQWQRLSFNPLWFALLKIQSPTVDKELDQARNNNQNEASKKMITSTLAIRNPLKEINVARIFLPVGKLETAKAIDIPFSSVQSVEIDNKLRLVDLGVGLSKDTVRELALRLRRADPTTFGLLTCLGATYSDSNGYSLIFRMPDGMWEPETLRARMLSQDNPHSLSDRFRLANQLARAVSSIHTFGMVHKSITPETIILLRDSNSTLGSAFLLGFEQVRGDAEATVLRGDSDWVKNVYRHPERQGLNIQSRYVMQHDIYSLGVCLLEIGLWTSFAEYDSDLNPVPSNPQTYRFLEEANRWDAASRDLVKTQLLSLATTELPGKMGTKYARIVESCLTCLDLGNEDFGDESEFQDDGIAVAVRYIEKVLMKLSDISV